jgi:signal peptidase
MLKKALKWTGIGLAIILMGLALFLFFAPRLTDWQIGSILSGSMEPALATGGLVVSKPVDILTIRPGEIILFHSPADDKLIIHRVVSKNVSAGVVSFTTKGDANDGVDRFAVAGDRVVGKMLFYVPGMGYFIDFIHSPVGFALCLAVPGTALIILEIRSLHKELVARGKRKQTPS